MKEKIVSEIESFSEVFDVLPENNVQNRKKKKDYLLGEIEKTKKELAMMEEEIQGRIHKISHLKENPHIKQYQEELEKCSVLNEFRPYLSSYEKMHLDYYLYQLHRYYKNDFQEIESCLNKMIESFKNCHISLSSSDFDFHPSVQDFMTLLLNGASSLELKQKFETLYWQFPELINAIEVNFKHIYLKYEKQIDKYFQDRYQAFCSSHKVEELQVRKKELISALEQAQKKDAYAHFQKFLNKEYLYSDFKESEIVKKRDIYFNENAYSMDTLNALYKILKEYQIILKYDVLFKDLRNLLNEKDQFKTVKQTALKAVQKEEKNLYKILGEKKPKLFSFKKKTSEDYLFQYKETLNKVIEAYDAYDLACFQDQLYHHFPKDSSALLALEFIASHYLYFVRIMKETQEDMKDYHLSLEYQDLKHLLNTNLFILLNQIALLDEYQMKQVIVDRYHLDGLKLTIESLEKDNLENTMKDIQTLVLYEDILSSGLVLDDVKFYLEVEKLKN